MATNILNPKTSKPSYLSIIPLNNDFLIKDVL